MKQIERWKDIPGFPLYQASDQGRIKSLRTGVILKPGFVKRNGRTRYLNVTLYAPGKKRRTLGVHTLVARAWLGPKPSSDLVLRHTNDDGTDNRVPNLSYGTLRENALDAVRNGVHPQAKKTHCPQGHEYTPDNITVKKQANGGFGRLCRACQRAKAQQRRDRKRAALVVAS